MALLSTAELANHVGIDDNEDDPHLSAAAAATCQAIAEWCGRTFDTTAEADASARVFRATCQTALTVDDFWSTTGLVVKTDDNDDGTFETTWTIDTDFYLEPLNGLRHGQPWPYTELVALSTRWFPAWNRRPAVQVTAAWGWASIPDAVKQAALLKGARLFKRKNSPEGVLSGFADYGPVRISSREDPDVIALLAPFRLSSAAVTVA
jgi:hypothetical protein